MLSNVKKHSWKGVTKWGNQAYSWTILGVFCSVMTAAIF